MTLDAVRKVPGEKRSHDVEMEADLADVVDCAVRATGQVQGHQQHHQPWAASVPNCRKMMRKSWNERSIAMSNWLLVQALA